MDPLSHTGLIWVNKSRIFFVLLLGIRLTETHCAAQFGSGLEKFHLNCVRIGLHAVVCGELHKPSDDHCREIGESLGRLSGGTRSQTALLWVRPGHGAPRAGCVMGVCLCAGRRPDAARAPLRLAAWRSSGVDERGCDGRACVPHHPVAGWVTACPHAAPEPCSHNLHEIAAPPLAASCCRLLPAQSQLGESGAASPST